MPIFRPITMQESIRRQLSIIEAWKDDSNPYSVDELEDLWSTLHLCIKLEEHRGVRSVLETLLSVYQA